MLDQSGLITGCRRQVRQRIANVTKRAKKRRVRRSSEKRSVDRSSEKRSVDRMTEETEGLRQAEVAIKNSNFLGIFLFLD